MAPPRNAESRSDPEGRVLGNRKCIALANSRTATIVSLGPEKPSLASKGERVDTGSVGLRATLTSLLTLVLLALSSVACACEIKCDMSMSGSSCGETQGLKQDMAAVASMKLQHACCGRSINFSTPSCHHEASANQPALLNERVNASYSNASTAVVVSAVSLVEGTALTASIPVRGPPRFRPASPVSLHTTLRV